jgi:hypothetical protein
MMFAARPSRNSKALCWSLINLGERKRTWKRRFGDDPVLACWRVPVPNFALRTRSTGVSSRRERPHLKGENAKPKKRMMLTGATNFYLEAYSKWGS